MPLFWKISSQLRLVEVEAEGRVTLADWLEATRVIEGAGAAEYKKLLDARDAVLEMTADERLRLIVEIRGYHERKKVGPLAVVTATRQPEQWAQLLGAFAVADRPLKVFSRERAARNWLKSL